MLYLHGLGHFHPKNVITNQFLESLDIGVDTAWIDERVGIRERRTLLDLDYIRHTRNRDTRMAAEASLATNTEMARRAAAMALDRARLQAAQIGMVMAGGCTPTMLIPAEATRIAAALEMHAVALDVNSACASFVAQLMLLDKMGVAGLPDFVLLVVSEVLTRFTNYSDRKTAVLFGDGAAAAIVSAKHPARLALTADVFATDPKGCDLIRIPVNGHFSQEGRTVQRFAVCKTVDVITSLRAREPVKSGQPLFVGHQANLRMLESVCRLAEIDEAEHRSNVASFGNCGAAGTPAVLSQIWEELAVSITRAAVVGSGLSWGGFQIAPTDFMGGVIQ